MHARNSQHISRAAGVIPLLIVIAAGCATLPPTGSIEFGDAPVVLARDEYTIPPVLHGGAIAPDAEYVPTAATFFPAATDRGSSLKSGK
jgi:hypothetical protein